MSKVEEATKNVMNVLSYAIGKVRAESLVDALIAAAVEDNRNRIEAEGFLLRDCNSVLQVGKCSVIPTAELNTIAEYCSVPPPKEEK